MWKWLKELFSGPSVEPTVGMKTHPIHAAEPNVKVNRNNLRMERLRQAIDECDDLDRRANFQAELDRRAAMKKAGKV